MLQIYVLPTEEGLPPRAILSPLIALTPEGISAVAPVATQWDAETEHWVIDNHPVEPELDQALTLHAKELGVEF